MKGTIFPKVNNLLWNFCLCDSLYKQHIYKIKNNDFFEVAKNEPNKEP
jgi:hypothetical protein